MNNHSKEIRLRLFLFDSPIDQINQGEDKRSAVEVRFEVEIQG